MLTDFDRELLNLIQTKLPVTTKPYAQIAAALGTDEAAVLTRLSWLKENGYIRRIGAFFDSSSLGYVSTLVAAKIKTSMVETVAKAINEYPGVTHNYERLGEFNLWFTLLTVDQAEQDEILTAIRKMNAVEELINLPALEKYKVSVEIKL